MACKAWHGPSHAITGDGKQECTLTNAASVLGASQAHILEDAALLRLNYSTAGRGEVGKMSAPMPPVSLARVRPTSWKRPPCSGFRGSADTMRAPGGSGAALVGACG